MLRKSQQNYFFIDHAILERFSPPSGFLKKKRCSCIIRQNLYSLAFNRGKDNRFFFRIKPGLWALKEFEKNVRKKFEIETKGKRAEEFNHTYYQGLLVEIGNLNGYNTHVPPQDKNKLFLEKKLGSIARISTIYDFSFPEIVNRAKTIDVIWFNKRKLPDSFFEIEHTTDIQNSLLKFFDLQDYFSNFYIVSAKERKQEFFKKIKFNAFANLQTRVKFIEYNYVAELHTKTAELERIFNL